MYAVDEEERIIANHRISVSHNLSQLRDAIKRLVPNAPIEVSSVEGAVVLSGIASSGADAEDARRLARRLVKSDDDIVNNISIVEPNQVNLRVRIAEVQRSVLKEFGVNWDTAHLFGDFTFAFFSGSPIIPAANPVLTGGSPPAEVIRRNAGTNSLFGGFNDANHSVNSLLDALDSEGLVTILAEPNLTAVSGKPATFLAGGEFPIVLRGADNTTSVQFKQFGVSLAFTPTIIASNRISLQVNPEVSQLSSAGAVQMDGIAISALSTRRAQTTVELGSGQSFAIAGLIQNNTQSDLEKFPGLGELPILGTLFRSDRFRRNESELVIIVTPYVVRPVNPGTRLALPTDGYIAPNDTDRLIRGHSHQVNLERRRPMPRGQGVQGLVGPAGFLLD
jgi:pilus assembly protein CpaC